MLRKVKHVNVKDSFLGAAERSKSVISAVRVLPLHTSAGKCVGNVHLFVVD